MFFRRSAEQQAARAEQRTKQESHRAAAQQEREVASRREAVRKQQLRDGQRLVVKVLGEFGLYPGWKDSPLGPAQFADVWVADEALHYAPDNAREQRNIPFAELLSVQINNHRVDYGPNVIPVASGFSNTLETAVAADLMSGSEQWTDFTITMTGDRELRLHHSGNYNGCVRLLTQLAMEAEHNAASTDSIPASTLTKDAKGATPRHFCSSCGAATQADAKFCSGCGHTLS